MTRFEKVKLFFSYFKPHKKLFVLDLTCAVLASIISVLFPVAINYGLNVLLPDFQLIPFITLMLGIIASYVINSLLMYIVGYLGHTLGSMVEADIRVDLFIHMQKLSSSFFDRHQTGSLMSRVTSDLYEMTELAHHGPEDALICIVTVLGSLIAMFCINWILGLCVLVLLIAAVLFILLREKDTLHCSRVTKEKLSDVNAELERSISGISVTKAFANEEFEKEKFIENNKKFTSARKNFFKAFSIYSSGMDFIKNLLRISVVFIGGLLMFSNQCNLAEIITFNLFIGVLLQPIQKFVDFSEILLGGISGFNRFVEIMEIEPEIADAKGAYDLKNVTGDIIFENVTFAYQNNDPIIENLNLHIQSGETIALVGASGAGKTTLCQLLPRFYEVQKGNILIDGCDIKEFTLRSLRKNIGIVQQNVFIFTGTIMDNIRYGNLEKSEEDVINAAKMAEIHEDIIRMEQGYQTFVGEKGAKLSGGQKQRISLARMFLKNPPIIILDEATSALDSITETKIQGAIDRLAKGRTMIVIAHRLSTVRNADRIIVLEKGKIKEIGTHCELLNKNGEYAHMYYAQFCEIDKE